MIIRLSLLALLSTASAEQITFSSPPQSRTLTLKHAIHISTSPNHRHLPPLHRSYSPSDLLSIQATEGHSNTQQIRTVKTTAWRPSSQRAYQAARRSSFYSQRARNAGRALSRDEQQDEEWAGGLGWREDEIEMPDTSDVGTLLSLAKLTSNAYSAPSSDWYDLEGKWNVEATAQRVTTTRRTCVPIFSVELYTFIFRRLTLRTLDASRRTTYFSHAVVPESTGPGQPSATVILAPTPVPKAVSKTPSCPNQRITPSPPFVSLLAHSLLSATNSPPISTQDLYNNVTALYPHAQIWLAGHSLGGSLASLLSLTYGVPSIAFEAPGELLPARRLHLPLPPGHSYSTNTLTTHIYHTADPIAMGVCNGATSTCSIAGFALETKCHTGRSIIYDTVGRLGWSVDIRTHGIRNVIQYLFVEEWGVKKVSATKGKRGWGWWPGGGGKDKEEEPEDGQHRGRGVPDSVTEDECVDCFRWAFEDEPALGLSGGGIKEGGLNITSRERKSCGGGG
ncbi:lipase ATG15, partial [Phenoliferia sp. Uapishka_3]